MTWFVRCRFPIAIMGAFSTKEEAWSRAGDLNMEFQTKDYYVEKYLPRKESTAYAPKHAK